MQSIPRENLSYPVLLKTNAAGNGSGFFLNTGSDIYLISARHVLFSEEGDIKSDGLILSSPCRYGKPDSSTEFKVDFNILAANGDIALSDHSDVCAFRISRMLESEEDGAFEAELVSGIELLKQAEGGTVNINMADVKMMDEVLISNDVYLFGYPSSLGMRKLPQFDYSKPLLRKGIVANIHAERHTIILDCPVYFGNSGGPVIQVELIDGVVHHSLIGVVSQYIPFVETWQNALTGLEQSNLSNSGYSVAVSMDCVFEMLHLEYKGQ